MNSVPVTRVWRLVIPHMRRDILSRVPLRQRRVKQAAGDSAHLPSVRTYQAIHPVLECAWIAAYCCSVALSGCNLQFFWERTALAGSRYSPFAAIGALARQLPICCIRSRPQNGPQELLTLLTLPGVHALSEKLLLRTATVCIPVAVRFVILRDIRLFNLHQ